MAKRKRDPKSITGSRKPALHLISPVAEIEEAIALKSGAEKHGPWNWRENRIELMEHIAAVRRHIARFVDGETADPETGACPLAHARATLGIIIDARACGTLIDDRPRRPRVTPAARAITRFTRSR